MRLAHKISTFLRLLVSGDFRKIRARWRYNNRLRLLSKADVPFLFMCEQDRLVCDPLIPDSASAFVESSSDHWERRIFRTWLRPGDVVVDAGANIGLFCSVAAACVGRNGKVIAIEPTPQLIEHLRMSAKLLPDVSVDVLPVALAGKPGQAKFAFASATGTTVSQSLAGATVPVGTTVIREVEVITLSTLAPQLKLTAGTTPSLIKLDIEGVEVDALQAAPSDWLTADGPLWVVECHPQALARFGATVTDVLNMFPATHFGRWMIGKYAGLNGSDLPPTPVDDYSMAAASFHNLIAVPLGNRWRQRRQDLGSIFPRV